MGNANPSSGHCPLGDGHACLLPALSAHVLPGCGAEADPQPAARSPGGRLPHPAGQQLAEASAGWRARGRARGSEGGRGGCGAALVPGRCGAAGHRVPREPVQAGAGQLRGGGWAMPPTPAHAAALLPCHHAAQAAFAPCRSRDWFRSFGGGCAHACRGRPACCRPHLPQPRCAALTPLHCPTSAPLSDPHTATLKRGRAVGTRAAGVAVWWLEGIC